jgi:hypothetical protein
VGALVALLGVPALGATAGAATGSAKTLTRFHDPLVVPVAALGVLPEQGSAGWRLYRVEGGRLVPIPFQLDPIDDRGDVTVDASAEFDLDADDQLVFMAKDTGDRATGAPWPLGSEAVLEIEVVDPVRDGRGWAYLVHFPGPAPAPAAEHYVVYDRAMHRARSPFYEVEYAPTRNFFTGLRIAENAGGNDRNLLRQTRMLGQPTFRLLLTDLTLRFTEQNSVVVVDGVRDGPVRAVRRVRLSVDLGRFFPDLPSGTVYTHHYLTSYTTPSTMKIPWLVLKALRDFSFEDVLEFQPDAVSTMRYWDGANRDGVGWRERGERRLATDEDHDWWVHSGPGGTMLHAFVVPEEWQAWGIVRGTVLREEAAGYSLLNMTRIRRPGSYRLALTDVVLPGPYAPGDEEEPLAMVRAPLRWTVRPLAVPVAAASARP